jgi:hypothetical protein
LQFACYKCRSKTAFFYSIKLDGLFLHSVALSNLFKRLREAHCRRTNQLIARFLLFPVEFARTSRI